MVTNCQVKEKADGFNTFLLFPTWNPFNNTRGNLYVNMKYPLPGDEDRVLYPFPPQQFYGQYPIKRRDYCVLVEDVFDILTPGLWGVGLAYGHRGLTQDQERWLIKQCFGRIIVWSDHVSERHTELVARLRSHPRPDNSIPSLIVVSAVGWAFDQRPPCEYGLQEALDLFSWCQALDCALPPYYGYGYE